MAGIGSLLKGATKVTRRIGDEFDPRFDPRKKEQERLQSLEVAVEPRLLERPQVSIADFEGYPFVTSMSDRTAAGGLLTDIRGLPLSEPVNLRGGQDFMFDYNPGQVWASGKAQASDIFSAAQRAKDTTGRDPIFLPWRMAPTGGDFATMTGETMLSFARDSMNKKTKRSLDSKLKKIIPNWPGIDSPDAIDVFRAAPDKARKAAKNVMDVEFRDRGGLSIGEARLAVADPAQLDAQQGGVQNVGRILTDLEMDFSTHPSYPYAVPGEGVGVLKEDINVFELLPDIVEARNIPDPLKPRDPDLRSMQMGAKTGRITPELLRKILGGGAGAAVGIEALLQEEAPLMAPGMALGGAVSAAARKAKNMGIGGIVKKAAILAPVNEIGLYSKAEDVAKKMPQAKGRGDDTRRYFKKQGVKDEEIDALGLDRLFRQDRVTQQEILDQIDQNRVVLEERVSTGPSTGSFDFDYAEEDLSIDEAYGQGYIDEEVYYYLNDSPEMFIFDDDVIDDYIRRLAPGLDRESDDALRTLLKDYGEGTGDFDDLPDAIQKDLEKQARRLVKENYDDNPVRRITLTAIDQDGDQQPVGDIPGASFSYSLIGNDDTGYGLSGLEYNDVPPNIRSQLESADIFSPDEAQVQLQAIASEYDDIYDMIPADTRWEERALPGGENYQEARLSLPSGGETKFRENVHFPDDINNVFHVRTKDRIGPTGERILYVEEVQSDWAQTGRKGGFRSPQKIEEAEKAAAQLFEEAAPVIDQASQSRIFEDGIAVGNSFLGSISNLSAALRRYRSGNRPLDAAADVFVALENADKEAKIRAVDILREDFLDSLTDEQAVDLYVRELMGEFGGGESARERLRRMYGDAYRTEVEREARERLARGGSYLDSVLIRAGEKTGVLPSKNAEGFDAIRGNPRWNEALDQVLRERERYLASKGADPKLMSKLQAALDRADPEGAKVRRGKEQAGLPQQGPFVLDTDSWNRLAVKYIFKKAAEEGYDGVSFAPGQAQVDRWNEPGLLVQYDQNIPSAIDKVIGPAPVSPSSNLPETMEVSGYESKIYRLDDPTKDGESIFEKMKAPTTMFGFAPLPLVLPQGIAALQGLSPEQAEEEKLKFEEFGRAFPGEAGPQPLPEALSAPVVADRATQRLIDAGFPREMAEQIVMGGPRSPEATFVPPQAEPINISAGMGEDLFGAPELTPPAPAAAMPQPGQDEVPDYMRRLDGSIKSESGFLGPIQNSVSGRTMTEVSVGQPGSEEGFYPLLVPTLTQEEIDTIANMDLGRERPPQAIIEKARAHAMDRMARGMSPFYQDDEPFDFRDASARSLAQEDVFGDYDQRQTAIASQALDRLQREAQMREGSIGPREALEAAATIGSSILGSVPAGLEGLFTLARTGDREAAEARINEIQEALTYMPRSQGSMDALQAAAGPLEALAAPSEFMGQQTLDITGSPALATAAELFLDPLNLLTLGGLGTALKRVGRTR